MFLLQLHVSLVIAIVRNAELLLNDVLNINCH